ncbi:hypothetical protein C7271_01895 [filamentous cyanobacterium CCP5]|nr:hypothetical protein C7271_01895 [filamentous cyanobacterium CCP5]
MNSGEIDRYTPDQVIRRYSIVKSAVYKRIDQLGIQSVKVGQRAYYTAEQVRLMDELHEHIRRGGNAPEFIKAKRLNPGSNGASNDSFHNESSALINFPADLSQFISKIVAEVLKQIGAAQKPNPLDYLRELEESAQKRWPLRTSDIADLLGMEPEEILSYSDQFFEAGFLFRRLSFPSRGEVAWQVHKLEKR